MSSTTSELGKDADHDKECGKITWISLKGEREARKLAAEYTKKAHEILKSVGGNSLILQELMNYMLNRNY